MKIRTFLTGGLISAFVLASSAEAAKVRPVNIEEMVERSARIVSGRCVRVDRIENAAYPMPVAAVTFEVDETLKGPAVDALTFKQVDGSFTCRADEEVILFLYGVSRAGLTSPVGLGQGKFSVYTDKRGQRLVVNPHRNRGLFRDLSADALGRLGTLAVEVGSDTALSSDRLREIVQRLED